MCVCVCVCGCRATYPAAAAASLLLLLLFNELHGGGRGRGRSHGSHHLDAVLWERGQAEPLPASHLHLLELLEPAQRKLERRDGHMEWATAMRWRSLLKRFRRTNQYCFPQQQEDLLHGEVWRVHAAELGHHGEEEQSEGLLVVKR